MVFNFYTQLLVNVECYSQDHVNVDNPDYINEKVWLMEGWRKKKNIAALTSLSQRAGNPERPTETDGRKNRG